MAHARVGNVRRARSRWQAAGRCVRLASKRHERNAPRIAGREEGMRLVFVASVLSLAALTPLAAEDDIVLRGMGSFHVGGRIAEVSGKPVRMIVRQPGGPQTKLDPNGQYMVEQKYVQ